MEGKEPVNRIWVKVVEMGVTPDPVTGKNIVKVKLEGGNMDNLKLHNMEVHFGHREDMNMNPWVKDEDYILTLQHRDEQQREDG